MGRILTNKRLLDKLTDGEYALLLKYIKNDVELSLEIRIDNQIKVYYEKSLVLTLFPIREPKVLSKGYWNGKNEPRLNVNKPEDYFVEIKDYVRNHKDFKANKEFVIQQKICRDNNSISHQFLFFDMEYQFSQEKISERTNLKTRFDLVAYGFRDNKIVLFELKQGLGATDYNSGVYDHFIRYLEHKKHPEFNNSLLEDAQGILQSKAKLELIDIRVLDNLNHIKEAEIDFAFIFATVSTKELEQYKKRYGSKYKTYYLNINSDKYLIKDEL